MAEYDPVKCLAENYGRCVTDALRAGNVHEARMKLDLYKSGLTPKEEAYFLKCAGSYFQANEIDPRDLLNGVHTMRSPPVRAADRSSYDHDGLMKQLEAAAAEAGFPEREETKVMQPAKLVPSARRTRRKVRRVR